MGLTAALTRMSARTAEHPSKMGFKTAALTRMNVRTAIATNKMGFEAIAFMELANFMHVNGKVKSMKSTKKGSITEYR